MISQILRLYRQKISKASNNQKFFRGKTRRNPSADELGNMVKATAGFTMNSIRISHATSKEIENLTQQEKGIVIYFFFLFLFFIHLLND